MTREEAIMALKMMNLVRTHPFLHWEEMMEVRDMAISALREQEERENPKPLTIEDLKQSEGRSVWWDWCGEYCLCKKEYVVTSNGTFSFNFVVNNGNAYRNKPKEE